MSRVYRAEQFIEALKGSGGIISTVAQRVGCSWTTARKWINEHPTVKAAYEDECESINDLAQSVLIQSIREGNAQDAKWWLAKKRKQEFGDSLDVTSGGEPLTIKVIYERANHPAA